MPKYYALAALNIRTGPGSRHDTLPGSPLPPGTRMQVIRAQDSWRLVDVLDEVNGIGDLRGWVHSRFITSAPRPARGPGDDAIAAVIP
jgi:uncharacterized protein YraI